MGTRIQIALVCQTCGSRNYKTTRATGPDATGLVIKKYCTTCNAHTMHHESR